MKRVEGWRTIEEEYRPFLLDESRLSPEPIDRLYFPETTGEAAQVLRECAEANIKVVFSGGRTGITGGAVPREAGAVVSTERLHIEPRLSRDPAAGEWFIRVGAGTTLTEIKDILARKSYRAPDEAAGKRFFFPVDPTETGAALGGMAATNASGARTLGYGPMRDWVRGLTVVLAGGSIACIARGSSLGHRRGDEESGAGPAAVLKLPVQTGGSYGTGVKMEAREYKEYKEYKEIPVSPVNIPRGKHSGGYCLRPPFDAVDLFVGSEGTLGLITELELRLIEVPAEAETLYLMIFLPPENLPLGLVAGLKGADSFHPVALEYMDHRSLKLLEDFRREQGEASGVPEMPVGTGGILYVEIGLPKREDFFPVQEEIAAVMTENGVPGEHTWAGFSVKTLETMKKLRHALPERINTIIAGRKTRFPELTKIGTDIAVPDRYLGEMTGFSIHRIENEGLEFCVFGHIGDGHLHINILPRNPDEIERAWEVYRELAERAVEAGGSVSAEHGIGRIKRKFFELQFSEEDRTAMRRVKDALDPEGLLNPGVLW